MVVVVEVVEVEKLEEVEVEVAGLDELVRFPPPREKGLSAIASRIGVPLYADEITSEAKILEFARICVEMQAGSNFPNSFRVLTEHNETFEVRVEYSWRPRQCLICNVFGHRTQECMKNVGASSSNNSAGIYQRTPTEPSPLIQTKPPYKPLPTSNHSPEQKTANLNHPKTTHGNRRNSNLPPTSLPPCTKSPDSNKFSPLTNDEEVLEAEMENTSSRAVAIEAEPTSPVALEDIEEMGSREKFPLGTQSGEEHGPEVCDSDASPSPGRWGHKIRVVDELDRKKKRNLRRSAQRTRKRNKDREESISDGLRDNSDSRGTISSGETPHSS